MRTQKEMRDNFSIMCREILDTEEPFYWIYNLSNNEKDMTIDLLLRAILGLVEQEDKTKADNYVEAKFYGAYNFITGKDIYP